MNTPSKQCVAVSPLAASRPDSTQPADRRREITGRFVGTNLETQLCVFLFPPTSPILARTRRDELTLHGSTQDIALRSSAQHSARSEPAQPHPPSERSFPPRHGCALRALGEGRLVDQG